MSDCLVGASAATGYQLGTNKPGRGCGNVAVIGLRLMFGGVPVTTTNIPRGEYEVRHCNKDYDHHEL
jgi:hypothetical protein